MFRTDPTRQLRFAPLLILSLIVALLSLAAPIRINTNGIALGYLFLAVWIGLLVFAIRTFRKKGLWFLIGGPIALLFPVLFALMKLFPK